MNRAPEAVMAATLALTEPVTPAETFREAGTDDAREAEYCCKMSVLLAGGAS